MKTVLSLLLILLSTPAFAQDAAKPPADMPADMKERLVLAAEFDKVRPIRTQIETTLVTLGETLPPAQKLKYLSDINKTFDYKAVETASVKALAETFTQDELKAMIAFYSSPAGKTAAAKMSAYEEKIKPEIARQLDAALAEIKFGK